MSRKKILFGLLILIGFSIYLYSCSNISKENLIKINSQNQNKSLINIPKINNQQKTNNITQNSTPLISKENLVIKLTVGNLKNIEVNFIQGQNLYQILQSVQNSKILNLTGMEYSGLGFFITSIGELKQGNGKYIFYSVNNKESSVGVSSYYPQNNDVIVFELK